MARLLFKMRGTEVTIEELRAAVALAKGITEYPVEKVLKRMNKLSEYFQRQGVQVIRSSTGFTLILMAVPQDSAGK
jgi:hypothetical protein